MDYLVKLPDIGEGIAEAELVEWAVKPGDPVREDAVVAAVMTDKVTVEIPSPVSGTVTWLCGEVGEKVAVKGPLLRIDVPSDAEEAAPRQAEAPAAPDSPIDPAPASPVEPPAPPTPPPPRQAAPAPGARASVPGAKPLASPAVRLRALEAGVDLRRVRATGPAGRVTHEDLDGHLRGEPDPAPSPAAGRPRNTATSEIKVTGLRRRIAERMSLAASRIPHITYVEEVDMTALEELRAALNRDGRRDRGKLTVLPFLMKAIGKAVADHPGVNATFDDEAGVVTRHGAVHVGVATQTPAGLTVPVVRHMEALGLWECAREMGRVTEAAREGRATREALSGSTITVSSLGALGGLVSTPIINHPEVAIVGVNKLAVRPHWDGARFVPRTCMNLSSSFDHRVVDGWDAASFIQRVKALLEVPATIFLDG